MKSILKKNTTILSLSFIFLFVIIISFLSFNHKQVIINYNKENLQILANEKASQVNMFLEGEKEKLQVISSMSEFIDVAKDPQNPVKIQTAKKKIDELKETIPGIGLLTKEGIIIVSETDIPGTNYGFMPQFPVNENSTIELTRYYDQTRKGDYYAIGGGLYDKDTKEIVGVITFDIELDKISDMMKETIESKTNEVYLIENSGLLLSNSKYIGQENKNGILIQEIKSVESEECLNDLRKYENNGYIIVHQEEIPKYLNYMGNEVYGAHAYVPLIDGCVIAEKSVKEISKYTISGQIIKMIKKRG